MDKRKVKDGEYANSDDILFSVANKSSNVEVEIILKLNLRAEVYAK